ncbi:MAG: HD-GYP domain-containing protein [Betaproteobacteria bacterium]|nr:HD-GYP domain-containing protein [Betaproteobacteria bacterium]
MQRKIPVRELAIGMFVEDLDRPWIDTPFLIQGFLIEDEEQLAQLKAHCQWVIVNAMRSTGDAYAAPAAVDIAVQRAPGGSAEPNILVSRKATPPIAGSPPPLAPLAPKRAVSVKPVRNFEPQHEQLIRYADKPASSRSDTSVSVGQPAKRPALTSRPKEDRQSLWGQLRDSVGGLFSREPGSPAALERSEAKPTLAPEKPLPSKRPGFVPETVVLTIYEDSVPVEEETRKATGAFDRAHRLLESVVDDIRADKALATETVQPVIDDMVDSMTRNPDAMMWVAKMREKDIDLYGHGLSVAVSLVAFGRHLGYPKGQLSQLGMVGFLLDVGKIKLPRELLEKHTRLTPAEYSIMREHVQLGLDILSQMPLLESAIVTGVAQHHERLDGSGYPMGLRAEEISVFGRMAAIADTFAALTRERPYAEAVSPHEALQKLSNWGGTQFQMEMVEQFIQSIGVFPVGSLVELSNGEVAVVVTHNKHKRLRPKVLVIADSGKQLREQPKMIDLIYDTSERPVYIRRGLPTNAYGIDPREYYLA